MGIEKRGTAYRIKKQINGKRYSLSFDHKPSKAEIESALLDKMYQESVSEAQLETFSAYAEKYMSIKSNVLSDSTKRSYRAIIRNMPEHFGNLPLNEVDSINCQALINLLAQDKSPKTVRNYFGFISTVVATYCPHTKLSVTMPQKRVNDVYIPTEEEVHALLDEIKGTEYEVAIGLACMGLRRSEICALTINDLNENIITISKALVQNEFQEWVIKPCPKTTSSYRRLEIPQYLADLIVKQGYVYDGKPWSITTVMHTVQHRLGQPEYSAHKLRHFFATYCHNQLKLSDRQIEELGGWTKGSQALSKIYSHSQKVSEANKLASEKIGAFFG